MAYTYMALARLGAGSTGLTLKAAIVNVAGTIHATVRDIACPERYVLGSYLFRTAAMPDDYEGTVVLYTGTLGAASSFSGVTTYHEELISPREVQLPFASENATAWGTRNIGAGRTADMYLQGLVNKIEGSADGLTLTLMTTDDVTPLVVFSATRLDVSIGGLRTLDPA